MAFWRLIFQLHRKPAQPAPTPAERFRQAFAPELAKIDAQRARHAQVKPSQAELEARVRAALEWKLSA